MDGGEERMVAVEDDQLTALNSEETWRRALWKAIIAFEGEEFCTSGRGSKPGVQFSYTISQSTGAGGRHYGGESIDGYGNEMFITTNPHSPDAVKLKKSISRSTVELAYRRAVEMGGDVKGPKALNIPGAGSYLYPVLVRFGVIHTTPSVGE